VEPYFTAGQYLTGSLFLRNNNSLHLDPGAVILGLEILIITRSYTIDGKASIKILCTMIAGQPDNISVMDVAQSTVAAATWWKAERDGTLAHPRPASDQF